ncbi:hypothetical protein [Mucilaginibacter polytrichastri]|uniref:HTTM domain-containing protein n=1 Tax=Mucilaginibacter polytrichastri TaxID=1302689 RepID=A0A1Q5ZWG6_9SPHI|nr:hypothetical protein [Mucilaginibacter polytrichastri]OKS86048.1 hypothetical protein RG47T_1495 [Mucilaginibacter polytrichastri]SFS59356.1 hypothetical protein SAMN04487890_10291 [Mucilaginibacter polytrichastri]
MYYDFSANTHHVLFILRLFIAASLLVSSIQFLINHKQFGISGLLYWRLTKTKSQYRYFQGKYFNYLFNQTGFIYLNIFRILLLPAFVLSKDGFFITVVLALTSFLIYSRASSMANAADQLNNVALLGLSINHFFSKYGVDENMIIYFFSIVLIISYFTSGLLKIYERKWINGYYLKMTLMGRNPTNRSLQYTFRNTPDIIFNISSKIVIAWQLSSFIIPFLPKPLLFIYLTIGLVFHISTGVFMGLNNFIWTFTAFLPCLIYTNSRIG